MRSKEERETEYYEIERERRMKIIYKCRRCPFWDGKCTEKECVNKK